MGNGSPNGSKSSTNRTVESPLLEASMTSFTTWRWNVADEGGANAARRPQHRARARRTLRFPIAGVYARRRPDDECERASLTGGFATPALGVRLR